MREKTRVGGSPFRLGIGFHQHTKGGNRGEEYPEMASFSDQRKCESLRFPMAEAHGFGHLTIMLASRFGSLILISDHRKSSLRLKPLARVSARIASNTSIALISSCTFRNSILLSLMMFLIKRAITFHSTLQSDDGHWTGVMEIITLSVTGALNNKDGAWGFSIKDCLVRDLMIEEGTWRRHITGFNHMKEGCGVVAEWSICPCPTYLTRVIPTVLSLRKELYNTPYYDIDWDKALNLCAKTCTILVHSFKMFFGPLLHEILIPL
ncbi:hypothetical protein Ahy_B10g102388 isoform B [Arachis hypogaea]|uniref:Uncharacterized protein n=1 Tax=Arachis hypogaea TaxID=3818 RepID=A0A444X1P9_ARAHY|nr:hypothetical protein Ahy_B10g102388 isoform B [Arachis hypogaea]